MRDRWESSYHFPVNSTSTTPASWRNGIWEITLPNANGSQGGLKIVHTSNGKIFTFRRCRYVSRSMVKSNRDQMGLFCIPFSLTTDNRFWLSREVRNDRACFSSWLKSSGSGPCWSERKTLKFVVMTCPREICAQQRMLFRKSKSQIPVKRNGKRHVLPLGFLFQNVRPPSCSGAVRPTKDRSDEDSPMRIDRTCDWYFSEARDIHRWSRFLKHTVGSAPTAQIQNFQGFEPAVLSKSPNIFSAWF